MATIIQSLPVGHSDVVGCRYRCLVDGTTSGYPTLLFFNVRAASDTSVPGWFIQQRADNRWVDFSPAATAPYYDLGMQNWPPYSHGSLINEGGFRIETPIYFGRLDFGDHPSDPGPPPIGDPLRDGLAGVRAMPATSAWQQIQTGIDRTTDGMGNPDQIEFIHQASVIGKEIAVQIEYKEDRVLAFDTAGYGTRTWWDGTKQAYPLSLTEEPNLPAGTYAVWDVTITIDGTAYYFEELRPASQAEYLRRGDGTDFEFDQVSEFHDNPLSAGNRFYTWDFEFRREGFAEWQAFRKFQVTTDPGADNGVRVVEHDGWHKIEWTHDASIQHYQLNDVFDVPPGPITTSSVENEVANIVITTPNFSDAASLTAVNQLVNAPGTNLQKMQPATIWQSSGLTNLELELDYGSQRAWNLASVLFTNASESASWRVRGALTAGELDTNPFVDTSSFDSHLEFDGVGDKVMASDASFSTTTLTLECLVRPASIRQQGIMKVSGGSVEAEVYMASDGKIHWVGVPGDVGDLTSTTVLDVDTWYHIAVTYAVSGGAAKLYINGVEEDSDTGVAAMSTGNGSIEISHTHLKRFLGDIDDVRFWNDIRTPTEIETNRTVELVGTESGLIGYWKFNDATGTTATDSTSTNADGTVTGAIWRYSERFWAASDLSLWESGTRHSLHWNETGYTGQFVRINILDPENTDGFFRAGRLYVSAAWQPVINMRYGSTAWGWLDESTSQRITGGQRIIRRRDPLPIAKIRLRSRIEIEMLEMSESLARLRGASKDILVVRNPDHEDYVQQGMIYGTLGRTNEAAHESYGLYQQDIQVLGLS